MLQADINTSILPVLQAESHQIGVGVGVSPVPA